MQIPTEKHSFRNLAMNPSNLRTHSQVPEGLAALLVEQLLTGETLNADEYVNAHYEGLRGHALDPSRLTFSNVAHLRSTLVVANANAGATWRSFGVLVIVSEPGAQATAARIFKRVDFYSVFPRSSNAVYLADVYLRLDVAKDGSVLKFDLGAVEDAGQPSTVNVYGSMLYIAALAVAAAELELLA
jgi:hypothetical protein